MQLATDVGDFRKRVVALLEPYERVEGAALLSDFAIAEARDVAHRRAARLGRIMFYDANEDGRVTRAEIADGFTERPEPKPKYSIDWVRWINDQNGIINGRAALMKVDADGSGAIDFAEAYSASQFPLGPFGGPSPLPAVRALFARDPNQDGRLTHLEAEDIAVDLFNGFDVDRDGKIDGTEKSALKDAWESVNKQEH